MKKACIFVLIVLFVCIFYSCASLGSLDYPQPSFDKPSVYVIDTNHLHGSFEDYVKLHNNSNDSNMDFVVYVHHPGDHEWIMYGAGFLKGRGDTDTISSKVRNIDLYRYFAIESLNGRDYKYQVYSNRNDLHITIMDD